MWLPSVDSEFAIVAVDADEGVFGVSLGFACHVTSKHKTDEQAQYLSDQPLSCGGRISICLSNLLKPNTQCMIKLES